METLTLKGLSFRAYHGYHEWERQEGNDFEVDLTFTASLRKAGESDQLNDTIDYQQVTQTVAGVMNGPPVKLIETLAKRIGDTLFDTFSQVHKLEVAVRKLHPPLDVETDHSEIRMSWQR